ncbi:MAG: hypothetical protein QOC57_231 [Ilumatobacteraceae bacterium]
MAHYRLVHIGAAALLAAGAMTTISVAQSVLASPTSASSFVPTAPCRLVDTRLISTVGTRAAPLGAEETATFAVSGTNGQCTMPSAATAIATNVTVINPTGDSFLTIFPSDTDRGHTSNLNWQATSPPVANQVTVGLSASGAINVYNNAGTVDVIIDISGYYEKVGGGQGIQGAQGAQGEPGAQGAQGTQGVPGVNGQTGDAVLAGLDCTDGQTITWSDTAGAWQCMDTVVDTLGALGCATNQSIRWDGNAWHCSFEPIVATLSRAAFSPSCCDVPSFFDSYSPNVDPFWGNCDDHGCRIHLLNVTDHTTCQVNVSGFPGSENAVIRTYTDHIDVTWGIYQFWADPLYVNISCNA